MWCTGVSDVELQDLLSLCDEVLDEMFGTVTYLNSNGNIETMKN